MPPTSMTGVMNNPFYAQNNAAQNFYLKQQMHINDIQQTLIDEIATFQHQRALIIDYIMSLGKDMLPLPTEKKLDKYLVAGCLSNVWIIPSHQEGKLFLAADSDALITKGLMALVVRVFSGQPYSVISNAELFFIKAIGLDKLLSGQRQSGLQAIINHIRQWAKNAATASPKRFKSYNYF